MTVVVSFMPRSWLQQTRWVWVYLQLERKLKYASEFIENRNDLASMYDWNPVSTFTMLYIETNSMLTAAILENLMYG